jgi:glycosyltransferase involved in cell wall biosynthesis
MKKIALVMGHFGLKSGGVLSYVLNLINYLSKDYIIHIFAGKDKFEIPNKFIDNKKIFFTFFSIKHKGFLKKPEYNLNLNNFDDFDIIWFHGAYMGWNEIAQNLKISYIYTPHGGFSNLLNVDIFRLLRRFFLFFSEYFLIKNAKFIQAVSESELSFLRLINSNTKIIFNYIFKKRKKIKKKKSYLFSYIGRLDPSKNINFLIKIIEHSNIKIHFYGYFTKSSSNYYKDSIKKNKNFSENFYGLYKGEKELSKIIQKYQYMILPSMWEGMPIVIYEAIENGVIPIISNQIQVPNFLKKFVITIDISDFEGTLKILNNLNGFNLNKNATLTRNAISVCQKKLNGSYYKSMLRKLII